ncbi:hypothetical protein [Bacillus timonensis]|nr:hypothetical protein [Bacillus timonensis]
MKEKVLILGVASVQMDAILELKKWAMKLMHVLWQKMGRELM